VNDPVFRRGAWWQQQDDGTWLRWNDGSQTWERSESPPPPPEGSDLPPVPPTPGQGIAAPYPRSPVTSVPVPNYLVWSILVTLFCFLPTGIAAIVYASQVNTKFSTGDVAGAIEASNKAKMWTIISAVIGVLLAVIVIAGTAGSRGPMFTP
jgi:Interferon-induced transmembrane protein